MLGWATFAVLIALGAPALAASPACEFDDVDVIGQTTAAVVSAELVRPYLRARFGAGSFYVLRGCGDAQVGLIFIGAGELEVSDPGPGRGPQLHARSEDLPGTVLFDAAVLWAGDGAVASLLAQSAGLEQGPVPPAVRAMLQSRSEGFRRDAGPGWRPPGEALFAPDARQGGLLAEFRTVGLRWLRPGMSLEVQSPWLSYVWAPTGPFGDPSEPGAWLRRATGSTLELLLSGFPDEQTVDAAGTPFAEASPPRPWDLENAEIALAASGPVGLYRALQTVEGDAVLALRAGDGATRHVLLALDAGMDREHGEQFAPFVVRGVATADGAPLPWRRVADRLWVELPHDPEPDERWTLRVAWRGDVLEVQGPTGITALDGRAWYPRPPGRDRHTVTTSVAVPAVWDVVATGHRIGEEVNGNVKIVTSRELRPILGAAVLIGDVRTDVLPPPAPGIPLVRLHRSPEHAAANARVGVELQTHLAALTSLLGPFPYSELEVIERGPVPGGRVDLPGVLAVGRWDAPPAQIVSTPAGGDSALGGLVRQWMEHDLGPRTDHDRWLIEGLVTWARCFALEAADQHGRCHSDLRGRQQSWLDGLTGGVSVDGDPTARELLAGAVWLDRFSGSAGLNRTSRGPLVLHGLRLLVGDGVARAALPRLMAAYGGQGLSVGSFLVHVQALAGVDLRAYVYAWAFHTPTLPVVRMTWSVAQQDDGSWTLRGSAIVDDGRDAEPRLPLPTPILMSLVVGEETLLRRLVLSEQATELVFDQLPHKPRDVRLDPGRTFPGRVEVRRGP